MSREGAGAAATISLEDVSKWYGPVMGVNQVTLEISPGITGLLGPNGAGKTTLMRLITGQLRPSLGKVRVLGEPVWSRPGVRRQVGFAPEVDALHEDVSGSTFVYALARLSGLPPGAARRQCAAALAAVGMTEHARKTLRACSKGMRQRVKIAQALVHDPEVLVLDEPLAGIDPPGRVALMALLARLRGQGKTILVSSHVLHEIESLTDTIILMARGRVLAVGALSRIRALIAEFPLTIRITSDRPRTLAGALLERALVVGVVLEKELESRPLRGDFIVKVRRPDDFFREFPAMVLELGAEVERLEALDASAEAVFNYLVDGAGGGGRGGAA